MQTKLQIIQMAEIMCPITLNRFSFD